MKDLVARSLALSALLLSLCALLLVLRSAQPGPDVLPQPERESPVSTAPRGAQLSERPDPRPIPATTSEAATTTLFSERVHKVEQDLASLRQTFTTLEKTVYFTVDQTSPDLVEEVQDPGPETPRTLHFAVIPLAQLAPSIQEVLEVHYRVGTVWHVFHETRWETRQNNLLVRTDVILGDELTCKAVCR